MEILQIPSSGHRCQRGLDLFLALIEGTLNDVRALQQSAPETPIHDIYYALAEERTDKSNWLTEFNYLYKLRDAGCFDPRMAPQPEQFAEVLASMEEKILLQASGVTQ